MTREEAVKIIKKEQEYCDFDSQGYEAFSMAIKALEQEQCDKCEVGNPCLYCKNEFESKYCDRNICIKNGYNGIGCDECEITKS